MPALNRVGDFRPGVTFHTFHTFHTLKTWNVTQDISHNSFAFGAAVAPCQLCHSSPVTKVKTSVFVNIGLLNILDLTSGGSSMWSDVVGHTPAFCYFFLGSSSHRAPTQPLVCRVRNHPLITLGDLGNTRSSQRSKLKMSGLFCFRKTGFFTDVEGPVTECGLKGYEGVRGVVKT